MALGQLHLQAAEVIVERLLAELLTERIEQCHAEVGEPAPLRAVHRDVDHDAAGPLRYDERNPLRGRAAGGHRLEPRGTAQVHPDHRLDRGAGEVGEARVHRFPLRARPRARAATGSPTPWRSAARWAAPRRPIRTPRYHVARVGLVLRALRAEARRSGHSRRGTACRRARAGTTRARSAGPSGLDRRGRRDRALSAWKKLRSVPPPGSATCSRSFWVPGATGAAAITVTTSRKAGPASVSAPHPVIVPTATPGAAIVFRATLS